MRRLTDALEGDSVLPVCRVLHRTIPPISVESRSYDLAQGAPIGPIENTLAQILSQVLQLL